MHMATTPCLHSFSYLHYNHLKYLSGTHSGIKKTNFQRDFFFPVTGWVLNNLLTLSHPLTKESKMS